MGNLLPIFVFVLFSLCDGAGLHPGSRIYGAR